MKLDSILNARSNATWYQLQIQIPLISGYFGGKMIFHVFPKFSHALPQNSSMPEQAEC